METITDFLKITIPQKVSESISEILHTSAQVGDLTIKLQTFETEYHVMHELMATFHMKQQSTTLDMETMNELLRKQNRDLIEQLAVCRGAILRLDKTIEACHLRIDEQQQRIERYVTSSYNIHVRLLHWSVLYVYSIHLILYIAFCLL